MVWFLINCSWAFFRILGKSKANITTTGIFPDHVVAEQSFSQLLHMHNKYRNRLDEIDDEQRPE